MNNYDLVTFFCILINMACQDKLKNLHDLLFLVSLLFTAALLLGCYLIAFWYVLKSFYCFLYRKCLEIEFILYLHFRRWWYNDLVFSSYAFQSALECLSCINRACFYGYPKPNTEKLITKIKEKDAVIEKLRQQKEKQQQDVEKCATDLDFYSR